MIAALIGSKLYELGECSRACTVKSGVVASPWERALPLFDRRDMSPTLEAETGPDGTVLYWCGLR